MDIDYRPDDTVKVLIVDDHPVVRFGLQQVLNDEADITVVGDIESGDIDSIEKLVEATRRTSPDVVILDLELGDYTGADALQQLHGNLSGVRVLVYTAHAEDNYILQLAGLGIHGYLLKGCSTDELVAAIRTVHAGGTVIDTNVAGHLIHHLSHKSKLYKDTGKPGQLSDRETEVLACLAKGKSNRAIASMLFICEATVKFHVHAILGKLQAKNRTEAVSIAVQRGLISLEAHR